jgi:predicted RNA-binding protein YlxR (DUF448 family)
MRQQTIHVKAKEAKGGIYVRAKKIPMRMCLGCGEMKPKKELVRVVKNKEGEISLDLTGRKAGRGAYVCSSADCLQKARKSRRLEKAFSQKIPDEIYNFMEEKMSGHFGAESGTGTEK